MQAVRDESAVELLAEVTLALSESLDYEKTIETVARILVPRYAPRCAIDVLADDGKLHRLAEANGYELRMAFDSEGKYLNLADLEGAFPIAHVLRTRQPFLVSRTTDGWLSDVTTNAQQRTLCEVLSGGSCLVVPLLARGRLIGAVSLGAEVEDAWSSDDLAVAHDVITCCAVAIDNARLHREAGFNARRLSFLADFSLGISSALHVEETIANAASRIVPDFAEQCLIHVVEPDGSFRRMATAYKDESKVAISLELGERYPPHRNPNSLVLDTARTSLPYLISAVTEDDLGRMAQDEHHFKLLQQVDCRSAIVVPVQSRGKLLGVLSLGSERRNRFGSSDLEFTIDLARRFATALENARLFEESETARRRLALLSDVSVALGSRLELDSTLSEMVSLLVPALASVSAVCLQTEDRLRLVRMACAEPHRQAAAEELLTRFSSGAPTEELIKAANQFGWTSTVVAPIESRSEPLGFLVLMRDSSQPSFGSDELVLSEELARRAAVAVENTRLFANAERERAEAQNALAALRRAEIQLRHSNEGLQQFAYLASHDLQEPLRTVSVCSQLLSRKCSDADPEVQRLVEIVTSGAKRMHVLINDLLAYSQLGHPGELQRVDTAEVVASCLTSLSAAIQSAGATVTYRSLPVVNATTQLQQVFQNLIDNAVKYRGASAPEIHIWAERHGPEWLFAVRDNGIGILPEYSGRIFELLKRLHGKEVPGTGIGLAACKKVVEAWGGRIWVESEPGHGSTFWFSLPA